MMRIDVLTLFPRMFEGPMGESIIGKAREKGLLEMNVSNFRDYSDNKHQTVDDYPYGGGAGMLLKVQPIYDNIKAIAKETPTTKKRVILLDPAGKPFNQAMAEEFSEEELFGKNPTSKYAPLNKQDITATTVYQGEDAIKLYGNKGKNGVVIITTKNGKPKN